MLVGEGNLPVIQGNNVLKVARVHIRIDFLIMDIAFSADRSGVTGIEEAIVGRRGNVIIMDVPHM